MLLMGSWPHLDGLLLFVEVARALHIVLVLLKQPILLARSPAAWCEYAWLGKVSVAVVG